jgi:hypothetical protein
MNPINPNIPVDIIQVEQPDLHQMQENFYEIMAFNAMNFDELDEDEQQNFIEELQEIAHDQNIVDELMEWGVDIHEFLDAEEAPEPIIEIAQDIQQEPQEALNNMDIIEDENLP